MRRMRRQFAKLRPAKRTRAFSGLDIGNLLLSIDALGREGSTRRYRPIGSGGGSWRI